MSVRMKKGAAWAGILVLAWLTSGCVQSLNNEYKGGYDATNPNTWLTFTVTDRAGAADAEQTLTVTATNRGPKAISAAHVYVKVDGYVIYSPSPLGDIDPNGGILANAETAGLTVLVPMANNATLVAKIVALASPANLNGANGVSFVVTQVAVIEPEPGS
jgi:hypothetical protein